MYVCKVTTGQLLLLFTLNNISRMYGASRGFFATAELHGRLHVVMKVFRTAGLLAGACSVLNLHIWIAHWGYGYTTWGAASGGSRHWRTWCPPLGTTNFFLTTQVTSHRQLDMRVHLNWLDSIQLYRYHWHHSRLLEIHGPRLCRWCCAIFWLPF